MKKNMIFSNWKMAFEAKQQQQILWIMYTVHI